MAYDNLKIFVNELKKENETFDELIFHHGYLDCEDSARYEVNKTILESVKKSKAKDKQLFNNLLKDKYFSSDNYNLFKIVKNLQTERHESEITLGGILSQIIYDKISNCIQLNNRVEKQTKKYLNKLLDVGVINMSKLEEAVEQSIFKTGEFYLNANHIDLNHIAKPECVVHYLTNKITDSDYDTKFVQEYRMDDIVSVYTEDLLNDS